MKKLLIFVSIFLTACAVNTDVSMYKGDYPKSEIAVVWCPNPFVNKIDGKRVFKAAPLDYNEVVELYRVLPGKRVFEVRSTWGYGTYGIDYKTISKYYLVSAELKAGHTYYMYKRSTEENSWFYLRDLGPINETFDAPIVPREKTANMQNAHWHREEHKNLYEEMKTRGVAVELRDESASEK